MDACTVLLPLDAMQLYHPTSFLPGDTMTKFEVALPAAVLIAEKTLTTVPLSRHSKLRLHRDGNPLAVQVDRRSTPPIANGQPL